MMKNICGLTVVILAAAVMSAGAAKPAATQPTAAEKVKIDKLVAQLGSDTYAVREAAQKGLIKIGPPAMAGLSAAVRSNDLEVRTRARAALKAIWHKQEILVKDLGKVADVKRPRHLRSYRKRVAPRPNRRGQASIKREGGQAWVVHDGKAGLRYRDVQLGYPGFSPDGKRLAYVAIDAKGANFVVLDGKPLGRYEGIGWGVFSPDSKRLAYTALRKGRQVVVCDGKEGKAYHEVFYPLFSPDSKSLAYWTRAANQKVVRVVWDEKVVARITGDPQFVFSPDSRQLAWGTYQGDVYRCAKAATKIATGHDRAGKPVFSPDGKHLAYAAGENLVWSVYVDGRALGGSYDPEGVLDRYFRDGSRTEMHLGSHRPAFSADGRHVFFQGTRGKSERNRKQFIVVDGVEGPAHDAVWIPDDFKNYPKRLRYVVRDGLRVRLVEMAWPEPLTWKDAIQPAKK